MILLKQPRIGPLLQALGKQLFPTKSSGLAKAYESAMGDCLKYDGNQRGYLVICTCLECDKTNMLRTGIFEAERAKFCYSIM